MQPAVLRTVGDEAHFELLINIYGIITFCRYLFKYKNEYPAFKTLQSELFYSKWIQAMMCNSFLGWEAAFSGSEVIFSY